MSELEHHRQDANLQLEPSMQEPSVNAANTLNIWGRMSSINVKKVVWTAQELGLDFQRTEAGGQFGVVKRLSTCA